MPEDLAQIEQNIREIECEDLECFKAGRAEAPVIYRPFTFEKAVKDSEGLMEFIASDESIDRMGDIIRAKGWKLNDFRKNPVFLWAHNSSAPPIGAVRRVMTEGTQLLASVEFAETAFAQEIKGLFDGNFMRAVSVGFRPLEFNVIKTDDGGFDGFEFTKQELLELSAVPVPANPKALRKLYGEFSMTVPDLKAAFDAAMAAKPDETPVVKVSVSSEAVERAVRMTMEQIFEAEAVDDPPEPDPEPTIEDRLAALEAKVETPEPDPDEDTVDGGDEIPAELADQIEELWAATAGKE